MYFYAIVMLTIYFFRFFLNFLRNFFFQKLYWNLNTMPLQEKEKRKISCFSYFFFFTNFQFEVRLVVAMVAPSSDKVRTSWFSDVQVNFWTINYCCCTCCCCCCCCCICICLHKVFVLTKTYLISAHIYMWVLLIFWSNGCWFKKRKFFYFYYAYWLYVWQYV